MGSEQGRGESGEHGIAFEEACEIFFDPFLVTEDASRGHSEARSGVTGMTWRWRLLYVVQIERCERLRIISARLAPAAERRRDEDG